MDLRVAVEKGDGNWYRA